MSFGLTSDLPPALVPAHSSGTTGEEVGSLVRIRSGARAVLLGPDGHRGGLGLASEPATEDWPV